MEPVRACPVCPACNSKRFVRLPGSRVAVRCRRCGKVIDLDHG